MSNEIAKQSPFEINTFAEAERYAKMIAESDFAPKDCKGKPGNVLIAMQMGHELGLKPMQAIQNIAVINGRPLLWGDGALALVRSNDECKGVREWMEGTIKGGDAIAYCEVKRKNETILREFSVKQATQANLLNKAGTWTQYPERMLQMRARGFALRDAFPDVLKGVYLKEEMDGVIDIEHEVIEHKEKPKLGVDAVKQTISQATQPIETNDKKELQDVNPETGEVEESSDLRSTFDDVKKDMENATCVNDLILAADLARTLGITKEQRDELAKIYKQKNLAFANTDGAKE